MFSQQPQQAKVAMKLKAAALDLLKMLAEQSRAGMLTIPQLSQRVASGYQPLQLRTSDSFRSC